jgi:hypothetical protein
LAVCPLFAAVAHFAYSLVACVDYSYNSYFFMFLSHYIHGEDAMLEGMRTKHMTVATNAKITNSLLDFVRAQAEQGQNKEPARLN